MKPLTTIGWREWASLPEWNIEIRAKADTGARSSAIDCSSIEELSGDRVRFTMCLSRKTDKNLTHEAPIAMRKHVRSSTGHGHDRLFVETTLRLGDREKKILVSLTCRKRMIHRMLLGREALSGDFVVDSSVDHWATPRKRAKSKSTKR
jgi:hypothetical protein